MVAVFSDLFKRYIGNALALKQINSELSGLGLEAAVIEDILNVLEVRREETLQILKSNVSKISSFYLKDFDWSVRLILSSDSISELQEPVLQLHFKKVSTDTNSLSNSTWELSKSQLDSVLVQFQEIIKQLEKFE